MLHEFKIVSSPNTYHIELLNPLSMAYKTCPAEIRSSLRDSIFETTSKRIAYILT